ncbi:MULTISPECIES: NCS2 family permease [Carnobacterium]|uniref:NCS2 family permease n=1 Tax=Carnobacterium TaxID=2747 RepID=UPI0007F4A016|nr:MULTISPECIES: NCS2 family permease [Carnobacterium]MCO6018159.1 NCS2 family permease [Carnobacterium divergens]MDT1938484.1 NCS2 family permease [Carnobacterium divergens]MDT1940922.1 NCS2 family permease [Carnobacterium divergens]MDT1946720.1 NCS2 family permease [Carnobacterium divergens]MDT1949157.1 NCS2 family permease [Carnobacterium divergens]
MSKFFRLEEHGTTIQTEIIAGLTTFLTMAYIIVVNPVILSSAGVPFNQVFMATILSAIVGTGWMALCANYPIAIAPGLGMNAYFVTVVASGVDYRVAFSSVFLAGIIFLLLSFTSLREKLIVAIPETLKSAITAGIGLFIAFVGLRLSGVIVGDKSNLVKLGDLQSIGVILTLIGILLSVVLMILNVKGSLFISMIVIAIISFFTGQIHFDGFMALPNFGHELMITDPITPFKNVIANGLYGAVLSFLLITIFDTTGTMIGVTKKAGLMKDGNLENAKQALLADAIGTTVGSIFGTSPTSAYIESGTGVAAGGRTGLTALTVAVMFAISSFFFPIVSAISSVSAITSPALVIVGSMMMASAAEIDWEDLSEAFPAFIVILTMPLTNSIATGLALGFITYPITKAIKGEAKSVHPLVYAFAVLFFIQLFFLGGH